MVEKPGKIVIISSPSGGGKTSICRGLLTPTRRKRGWQFSVSYTTREKRPTERNGREYCFVQEEEFDRLARSGAFAEHFQVHLYRYGTPRAPIDRVLKKGGVLVLDVDVQGARRLKQKYADAVTIFILPPSKAELRRRLKKRGTETAAQLAVRFENAKKEMSDYRWFEYTVVNKELEVAVRKVLSIVEAHFCRSEYMTTEQIASIVG